MRTPLELWLIVEENFDHLFNAGLCGVLFRLHTWERITIEERNFLFDEVRNYGLKRFDSDAENFSLWDLRKAKPRKMFIQKKIMHELRK